MMCVELLREVVLCALYLLMCRCHEKLILALPAHLFCTIKASHICTYKHVTGLEVQARPQAAVAEAGRRRAATAAPATTSATAPRPRAARTRNKNVVFHRSQGCKGS